MAETSHLLPIGTFSSLARLSVRMLRHYDEHGVLTPAVVDPHTGYRYYSPRQLRDAADVRDLRDIGVGVSAIPALLATRGTPQWHQALELQRDVLRQDLSAAQGRLTLIDHMLNKGEPTMNVNQPITVRRDTVPAMTVVALRGTVPTYADEGLLWQRATPLLERAGIEPIGPCGVIEHSTEYVERDVELSIIIPVAPGTTAPPPLEVIGLPERECLIARVVGPYTLLTAANGALATRLSEGDLYLASADDDSLGAKGFNLYLTDLAETSGDDLVTEVCWPLVGGAS